MKQDICVAGGAICGDPVGVYVAVLVISALIAIVAVPVTMITIALIRSWLK